MKIKLSWVKSASVTINQELAYSVNNVGNIVTLDKNDESYLFSDINEGDSIKVSLKAFNGSKFSIAATSEFTAPTTPMPAAPSNLTFEVVVE